MPLKKWDMPMAYSATNFHSQNGVLFADAVRIATGGEVDITVHPGGSLFKGNDIKKAVQTGQAPIGERLYLHTKTKVYYLEQTQFLS
jgi:TRAP-type C4-dicarboxylate transport system substrate-binding protein